MISLWPIDTTRPMAVLKPASLDLPRRTASPPSARRCFAAAGEIGRRAQSHRVRPCSRSDEKALAAGCLAEPVIEGYEPRLARVASRHHGRSRKLQAVGRPQGMHTQEPAGCLAHHICRQDLVPSGGERPQRLDGFACLVSLLLAVRLQRGDDARRPCGLYRFWQAFYGQRLPGGLDESAPGVRRLRDACAFHGKNFCSHILPATQARSCRGRLRYPGAADG